MVKYCIYFTMKVFKTEELLATGKGNIGSNLCHKHGIVVQLERKVGTRTQKTALMSMSGSIQKIHCKNINSRRNSRTQELEVSSVTTLKVTTLKWTQPLSLEPPVSIGAHKPPPAQQPTGGNCGSSRLSEKMCQLLIYKDSHKPKVCASVPHPSSVLLCTLPPSYRSLI